MLHASTDRLFEDLRRVVHDAEELLHATAGQAGEHIAQARAKAEASLRSAREQLAAMTARTRRGAECADSFAHDNPWITAGVGVAIGLLLGLLVGRRHGAT